MKHILVVEDNAAMATVIQFNLEKAGFHVSVARNGRVALDLAQEAEFDLVITDHQMPEMTGCELCERLRGMREYAHVPILLLTAKGLELDLPKFEQEFGVAMTFHKPFSPAEVVQAVEDYLAPV